MCYTLGMSKKKRFPNLHLVGNRNNIILGENIRSLYLQGKSYEYICQSLSITKNTINTYRRNALKEGDDWDALLLLHKRNTQHLSMSEAYFISMLIESFERQMQRQDLSLEELAKFVKLYYQLKQPRNTTDLQNKEIAHANTQRVIKVLANLALQLECHPVIEFLSTHADAIIKAVFKP